MELVDVLHGTFSLVYVIISFTIGLIILLKYFKFRNRLYILVGLTWGFLSLIWLPDSVSFLRSLFFPQSGQLSEEMYFIIGNAFEKKDYYKDLSDFIIKIGVDVVQVSILTPIPGSNLFNRLKTEDPCNVGVQLVWSDFCESECSTHITGVLCV